MKNQGFSKIRSRLKSLKIPVLILLTGILLISILSSEAQKGALERLRKQFVIDAATRASIIQDTLEQHLIDLEGLHSFYNASTSVTRKAFAAFVAPTLKTRPGIQAFEWIPRVAYPELARFEAEARRNGLQDYQIYQLDSKGNKVAARPRQYYYPVYYVEPLAGNEAAVGFDLGSNPTRRAALEQAADTGQAVATERIRLVQETGTQAGFLIFIPVYRQEMPLPTVEQRRGALRGFVLGVFRAGDAIEAAVRHSPEKGLLTELVDLYGPLEARVLYRFERGQLHLKAVTWKTLLAPAVTLRYEHPFTYAGRQWMVNIIASPDYVQEHISLSYWLIPPIGVLLTLLLALYFGALLSHKERAEQLAVERTAALTKTTNMLSQIINAVPQTIYWKDRNSVFMGCNSKFAQEVGLEDSEAIIGKTNDDLSWPRDKRKLYLNGDLQIMEEDHPRYHIIQTSQQEDGTTQYLDTTKIPIHASDGKVIGVLGVYEDITERKRAEEALHRSEQKYRLLVSQIPAMVFQGYGDWSIEPIDEKVEVLTGYSKKDFESRRVKWCDLIPAEDLDYATRVFMKALKTDKSYVREHRLRKKDGEIIWVQCRGQIFLTDRGKVDYISGVSFDVTQRRQAEEALLKSERQYRLLAENVIDVIWTMDLNWKFTYASPSCESLCGYTDKEIVGLTLDQLLAPDSMALCKKTLGELLSPENLARQEYPHFFLPQLELRFKDGSRSVYIEVKGSFLKDSQDQPMGMVGVTRDITERKQLEEQFLQVQKMEAVGTLAGGIAHDFNNILTAILGNIGLAVLDDRIGPRVQDRLAQAEEACLRAQALSQQLLTFAKGGAPVKKLFSVAELLSESTTFASVGSPVRCEPALPEGLWWIEADPGQIGQVFQNLTINAIQAMPTGGTIKVEAENLTLGTDNDLPLSAGRYIKISVRDQGMGIPAEHLPRIFDPYFTTKQKGSGLGLASAYAIIKKHHGHIAVESKPGAETTFYIYLPAVDQQVTPQPEDRELLFGKGKILVMDDEEIVREVLGRMLARLGYEAEFARDGGEAIEMFVQAQGFGPAFAAVILDLTVPGGMGGKEAMARLLEIDPRAKAVVSSGYSDDPIMAEFAKHGFSGVIAKPYRLSELSMVLNKVISKVI